jgi:hypothetical protein
MLGNRIGYVRMSGRKNSISAVERSTPRSARGMGKQEVTVADRLLHQLLRVRVPRPHSSNRFRDHERQYHLVHICELLDVEAAFAGRVLPELGELRFRVVGAEHVVQNRGGLTGRETDKRHVAFTSTVVPVVVAAEPDD